MRGPASERVRAPVRRVGALLATTSSADSVDNNCLRVKWSSSSTVRAVRSAARRSRRRGPSFRSDHYTQTFRLGLSTDNAPAPARTPARVEKYLARAAGVRIYLPRSDTFARHGRRIAAAAATPVHTRT